MAYYFPDVYLNFKKLKKLLSCDGIRGSVVDADKLSASVLSMAIAAVSGFCSVIRVTR